MPPLLLLPLLVAAALSQPTPSDNCLVWNNNLSVCEECFDGFFLIYYFCSPCNPLCSCSNVSNFCESCRNVTVDSELGLELVTYRAEGYCHFCNDSILNCLICED